MHTTVPGFTGTSVPCSGAQSGGGGGGDSGQVQLTVPERRLPLLPCPPLPLSNWQQHTLSLPSEKHEQQQGTWEQSHLHWLPPLERWRSAGPSKPRITSPRKPSWLAIET